ncbi:MAG: hypothetical protein JSV17_08370 [Candidatus Aminicenantes bacterium]|nr:MAG: hypothetical protein JSV17_08370 [Candidatus Aminicenantes bacterium]
MHRNIRSALSDLAFPIHSLRESDEIGLEDCLSTGNNHRWKLRKAKMRERENNVQAQFRRAEKNDEGMALKS